MSFKKQRMVKIRLRGSDLADLDFWSKSDPFLVLSRPCRNSHGLHQVGGSMRLRQFTSLGFQVRKTETIWNNLNPEWKILYIPTKELCDDDFNMRLQVGINGGDYSLFTAY